MRPNIAVYGDSVQGQTIAADLTLAGYQVNLLKLSGDARSRTQELDQIHLHGEETRSGKTGLAKMNIVTKDPKEALEDAHVIFVCSSAEDVEARVGAIAPYLKEGQILNFNLHGYWPCLRVVNYLKQMHKEGVLLSENAITIVLTRGKDGHVTPVKYRPIVPLGVFPSEKGKRVLEVMNPIFPSFQLAGNVLQTGLESINVMIHPAITLLNIGWFERAEKNKEKVQYYNVGNTPHSAILSDAFERERRAVCDAYGVPFTSLKDTLIRYYETEGETTYDAIRNCKTYQKIDHDADIWRTELLADPPYLLVPLASLADLAGIDVPLTKAFVNIMGAILGIDFWETGLTVDKMGLSGLTIKQVVRYVTDGVME